MNIIVFILLGCVLGLAICFFAFTFIRDKKKKQKIREEKMKMRILSEKSQNEIIIEINNIIDQNEKALKEFEPSIGKLKMSDINNLPRKILKSIIESNKYKKYIKTQEDFKDFETKIEKLEKNRASTWNKTCNEEIMYFKNKREKIILDDKLKKYDDENKKIILKDYLFERK